MLIYKRQQGRRGPGTGSSGAWLCILEASSVHLSCSFLLSGFVLCVAFHPSAFLPVRISLIFVTFLASFAFCIMVSSSRPSLFFLPSLISFPDASPFNTSVHFFLFLLIPHLSSSSFVPSSSSLVSMCCSSSHFLSSRKIHFFFALLSLIPLRNNPLFISYFCSSFCYLCVVLIDFKDQLRCIRLIFSFAFV